jgi:hypothetical protein
MAKGPKFHRVRVGQLGSRGTATKTWYVYPMAIKHGNIWQWKMENPQFVDGLFSIETIRNLRLVWGFSITMVDHGRVKPS